jgi:predicted aspartyl protease
LLPIGRSFKVPAVINGRLQIEFLLDSGADYVSIPENVVSILKSTGTLTEKDFSGSRMFVLADGSKVPGRTFFLHSLKVGSRVAENVPAVVARVGAPLLLGQSFLKKFDAWSIDNGRRVLMLEGGVPDSAPLWRGAEIDERNPARAMPQSCLTSEKC